MDKVLQMIERVNERGPRVRGISRIWGPRFQPRPKKGFERHYHDTIPPADSTCVSYPDATEVPYSDGVYLIWRH